MRDETIDHAILSVLTTAEGRWRKIAMVISRVAHALGNDLPGADEGYERVARRIEVLVGEGRLVSQGDIKNWRFSEIRLPR